MKKLNFETTAEARSYFKSLNKTKEALDKLQFPTYRIVDDAINDEHLGRMHFNQWKKVEADITLAMEENSQVYFECEAKLL